MFVAFCVTLVESMGLGELFAGLLEDAREEVRSRKPNTRVSVDTGQVLFV